MKSVVKSVVTLCLLLIASSLIFTRQDRAQMGAEENRILSLENAWSQAEQHKDMKILDELLSVNLAYVEYDGTFMTKADYLASRQKASLQPAQVTNESTTVHIYGNSAVVTGVYKEKGVNNGKSYEHRGRFTDTWVSENGVWRCVASQSTLISH